MDMNSEKIDKSVLDKIKQLQSVLCDESKPLVLISGLPGTGKTMIINLAAAGLSSPHGGKINYSDERESMEVDEADRAATEDQRKINRLQARRNIHQMNCEKYGIYTAHTANEIMSYAHIKVYHDGRAKLGYQALIYDNIENLSLRSQEILKFYVENKKYGTLEVSKEVPRLIFTSSKSFETLRNDRDLISKGFLDLITQTKISMPSFKEQKDSNIVEAFKSFYKKKFVDEVYPVLPQEFDSWLRRNFINFQANYRDFDKIAIRLRLFLFDNKSDQVQTIDPIRMKLFLENELDDVIYGAHTGEKSSIFNFGLEQGFESIIGRLKSTLVDQALNNTKTQQEAAKLLRINPKKLQRIKNGKENGDDLC